jgi:hypothetical protein
MPDRLDPTFLRAQIELLRVTHPGIWDAGDETLLADMLEGETGLREFLETGLDAKLKSEELIDGIGIRMANAKARRDRFEQRSDAVRQLMFKLMTHAGLRRVVLPEATLSIRAGQPRVIITDETLLPPDCVRVRTEPDKVAIKERLARGEPVPGATLSNSESVLSVRTK